MEYKQEYFGSCNSSCLVVRDRGLSHCSELTVRLSQLCSNLGIQRQENWHEYTIRGWL